MIARVLRNYNSGILFTSIMLWICPLGFTLHFVYVITCNNRSEKQLQGVITFKCNNRYEKQLQQEETMFQQQRQRLYSEVREEKERLVEMAQRQRAEVQQLQRRLEDMQASATNAMHRQFEKERDELECKHSVIYLFYIFISPACLTMSWSHNLLPYEYDIVNNTRLSAQRSQIRLSAGYFNLGHVTDGCL